MAQVKAACATTTTTTTTISERTRGSPAEQEEEETTTRSGCGTTTMPVASVTLCQEGEDKELSLMPEAEEEDVTDSCQVTAEEAEPAGTEDGTSSVPPSLILPEADNLSVSSPDSGHGTTSSQSDGQSEHEALMSHPVHHQHHLPHHHLHSSPHVIMSADGMTAVLPDPGMMPHPMHYSAWMNGQGHHPHQHRVMEPVAINPETGFTTVLVDASAMAGYPHHLQAGVAATPWPPHHHHHHGGYAPHPHHHHHHHHHGIPTGHFQAQQPQPPPHFLHPHTYHHDPMAPVADYGVGYHLGPGVPYDSTGLLSAPPYDPTAGMFDPSSLHLGTNGNNPGHFSGNKGGMGRNHRATRGSSVSPKRPANRSASQNSGGSSNNQRQRGAGGGQPSGGGSTTTSGGGRYTPSPSSGRSRGSSPGQPPLNSAQTMTNNHSGNMAVPAGPAPPTTPGQHVVHLHVNPGETVSLQMGGQVQVIQGPATVRMVSTGSPPVPLPVQVPPGHVLQQIVDERGTLRHVILSPAPASATGQPPPPSSAAAAAAAAAASSASAPVGVLPLPTPSHPPPPPPHYGSNIGQPPPPQTTGTTAGAATTPPLYVGGNGQGGGGGGYTAPHGANHHHHHQQQPTYGVPNLMSHGRPHPQGPHPHPQFHGFTMTTASVNQGPCPPSPPSPPSVNFSSERAQRQFAKLRKKLESRSSKGGANLQQQQPHYQSATSSTGTTGATETPPSSPKKDNNNIRKLKDRNQNGVPELSSSSSTTPAHAGEDETDAKARKESLLERITELRAPQMCDVQTRSATVSWDPVETVIVASAETMKEEDNVAPKELDISYEVVIGQKAAKGASSQERSCFKGTECRFRCADLQPGTDYWIRVSALVDQIKVRDSPVVEFRTESCAPDAPAPPKLGSRTKNSLLLRWSSPAENGSPITSFILEWDDGTGNGNNEQQFSEAYRGRNKQFTVSKLQSSTCYAFRLAACNEIGMSEWSDLLRVTTMGAPPPAPLPPNLRSVSAKQISLVWEAVSADLIYTLQMADPISGHGFLNVYHGPDNEYTCSTGLVRSTTYRFRLQAQNDDGMSRWSEEVSYSTAADRPAAPARPSVKGRILAQSFKVRWDPPSDSGGAPICHYFLELDSGAGFAPIWNGPETELTCDKLKPGTTYRARISCSNGQEQSDYSEPLIVTTEPVCPGPNPPPTLVGKAKANSLHLKWDRPEYDGGSMITQYEVSMMNPDGSSRIAYLGYETECLVASLLPGRSYSFQVRASNRIGFGPWSDLFETKSGPGAPDVPALPQLANRSSHSITMAWNEPSANGAPISEYRLEVAHNSKFSKSSSSLSSLTDASEAQSEEVDMDQLVFALSYNGTAKQHEVKGLHPATTYYFRVQAVNAAGSSGFSEVASFTTLPSSPAVVSGVRCVAADATSLSLSWSAPHSNGSPILHYNVEVGDKGVFCTNDPVTSFDVLQLVPNTQYRIRVQAANAVGVGPFCTAAKFSTRPLPPDAPRLECAQASYNSLKLRWGDGKNLEFNNYSLEMREEGSDKFYLVYEGPSHSYRVTKLKETSSYTFRICARNEVGDGPYSEDVTFTTTRAPPPALKKVDVADMTETSCRIAWSTNRLPLPTESVTYQIEINRSKEQDPIVMKRCTENETVITGLEPRTEYSARVCPIRLCSDGEIAGAYAPPKTFSTLSSQIQSAADPMMSSSKQMSEKIPKPLTDQHWAMIIISALIAFSILIAVVMNQLVVT